MGLTLAVLFYFLVASLVHLSAFSTKISVNHASASKGKPFVLTRSTPVWGPLISKSKGPLRSGPTAPVRDDSTKTTVAIGPLGSTPTTAPVSSDSPGAPVTLGPRQSSQARAPVPVDSTNSPTTFGSIQWTATPGTLQVVLATSGSGHATTGEVSVYSRLRAGEDWIEISDPILRTWVTPGSRQLGKKVRETGARPLAHIP